MASSGEMHCRYWFFAALRPAGRSSGALSARQRPLEEEVASWFSPVRD
jgi:hypothetical protein